MNVHVTFALERNFVAFSGYIDQFKRLATSDRVGVHKIVESPHLADAILFIDAHVSLDVDYYDLVDKHPLTHKYPEKVFVYDEYDIPPGYGRGLYVSMPSPLFNKMKHRSVCYWSNPIEDEYVHENRTGFCFFAGSVAHNPTRKRIVKRLAGTTVEVVDTSAVSPWRTGKDAPTQEQLSTSKLTYIYRMARNRYCIAPRGNGAASIRLFESMCFGTVPIILADDYVRPDVEQWDYGTVTLSQRYPSRIIDNESTLLQEFCDRHKVVTKLFEDNFSRESRWNFFCTQLELLINSSQPWQTRTAREVVRNNLHWIQHRLVKRIESRFV